MRVVSTQAISGVNTVGMLQLFDRSAARLRQFGNLRLIDLLEAEIPRARLRVSELKSRYPSADNREVAQRLIEAKKTAAGTLGGVAGVFGWTSIAADLIAMAWLQLSLLADLATLYGQSPKSDLAKAELLDLLAYANGINPIKRSAPRLLGTLASKLLERGGIRSFGRVLPLVAVPLSAYLNHRHIQQVGDEMLRHYEGFPKARAKTESSVD
ncbi:MAG: EcsC family protein [Myxococcaceae bacterium]